MPRRRKRRPPLTARTADAYDLYQRSVQDVEHEIDFVDRVFKGLRGRRAETLREDFCGTGNSACEWVRRRRTNVAVGLDLDPKPLAWGREHNVARLSEEQRGRVRLVRGNVLAGHSTQHTAHSTHEERGRASDVVLAMNFSYWTFKTRELMLRYFTSVRRSLARDGVFFLDFFGGSEVMAEMTERTRYGGRRTGFTYVWDQASYNPINGDYTCHIDFEFPRGPALRRAFTYHWRVWTLPELRDIFNEAGFGRVRVYCEGDDGKGGGNGVFRPTERAPADRSFVAYIVAER